MVLLEDLIWPTTHCQIPCYVCRESMLWVARKVHWPGKSGCRSNAGCLPRTLCTSLEPEFEKRNSIKGSQVSPLLHLEFQNLHFMCQSFRLQAPHCQTLASDTTCLLGMFFRLQKLTGQMKNNLFNHPHYSFDAGIMKMSISQQRKWRNGKNITYLRWGNQHHRQC